MTGKVRALILVLGDQLSLANPALANADPRLDVVVMAEVKEEAGYVPHNQHKIALIFAAMRHFCEALRAQGFTVHYFSWAAGKASLLEAVQCALQLSPAACARVCEPGEYRLRTAMQCWESALGVSVEVLDDTRFLATREEFHTWAEGRKQLRMEYFYRDMRRKYDILLEPDGRPAGDRWNYDKDNRVGWRGQVAIPAREAIAMDEVTTAVLAEVAQAFAEHPGDLRTFNYAVTAAAARAEFDWFCEHALPLFGTYQDALVEESPWVFHSKISMYLNIGLLEPLALCRQVEQAWRDERCSLAAAEGFIRQVLGWREYVRCVYWRYMPEYGQRNTFNATVPLPAWFWTGNTEMRCLQRALRQSLDLGYAHHIQRLMVIGNFALLAGLDVREVCSWYLAVYVDAFEWVELPNTLGMALHGDNGLMASKPYAASGKYIQRQGNHCGECRYSPAQMTGTGACPFNALYWRFIDNNLGYLADNPRMNLVVANWRRRPASERNAITAWGDHCLQALQDPS